MVKSLCKDLKVKSPARELKEYQAGLAALLSKKEQANLSLQEQYAQAMDQYFRLVIQESITGQQLFSKKIPFALVAVGGYGRAELSVHSDVDMIILFDRKIPSQASELMKELFFPLWDLGLDIGYGTRTIKDCVSMAKRDFQVFTSLLDARFICGDSTLFLKLAERLRGKVIKKSKAAFLRWLKEQDRVRAEQFGDASYMLEPNLKEGLGGLRDYHHLLWVSKVFNEVRMPRDLEFHGILSHGEFFELQEHVKTISTVRNHLHLLSKRRNDRLWMDYQEEIARRMGYHGGGGQTGVEAFLSNLHSAMAWIKALYGAFSRPFFAFSKRKRPKPKIRVLSKGITEKDGELFFEDPNSIISDPHLLMKIFLHSATSGAALSMEARRLVREFSFLVDEAFRWSRKASELFLEILHQTWAFQALEGMNATGFLQNYIPEFARVKDRVQFDTYHIFPVGMHLLQTLRYIKEVGRSGEMLLTTIMTEIKRPEILFLAALLHDIGKWGKDHAELGAHLAAQVLQRLGYEDEAKDDLVFLIRHHLLMVETATRRDLEDEKTVVLFARRVRTLERLKMLYLLTWADAKATGPRAWNAWIADLVQELFFKALHILEQGELASEEAANRALKTRDNVKRLVSGKIGQKELERLFEVATPRYLLTVPPAKIAEHFMEALRLQEKIGSGREEAFFLEAKAGNTPEDWQLTFIAKDRPGIFFHVAGVLALHNINVLSANIYTWRNGIAIDLFNVSCPLDPLRVEETWFRIREDLKASLAGKLIIEDKLKQKRSALDLSSKHLPTRPPKVIVDNQSSDFFTIIEIYAHDRVGLLYLITHAMFELGLDIKIAKIGTKVDQVADIFYVRNRWGQKASDTHEVEAIKNHLLKRLD